MSQHLLKLKLLTRHDLTYQATSGNAAGMLFTNNCANKFICILFWCMSKWLFKFVYVPFP